METPSNTAVTENSETAPEDTEVMSVATNSIRDGITSELHLESLHSSMQSLKMEDSLHAMESGSMITIASIDDQGDQGDQGDHCVHAPWGPKRPRGPRQKSNIKRSLTIPYPGFERKAKQVGFPTKARARFFTIRCFGGGK